MRVQAEPEHTATLAKPFEYRLRFIAQRWFPEPGVGMGNYNWPRTDFYRFQSRSLGRMAHINHEANAVHFFDDFLSHTRDAGIVSLVATGAQQ